MIIVRLVVFALLLLLQSCGLRLGTSKYKDVTYSRDLPSLVTCHAGIIEAVRLFKSEVIERR